MPLNASASTASLHALLASVLVYALLLTLPFLAGCDSNGDDDPEPLEGIYEIERFEFVPTASSVARFDLLNDTLDTSVETPTLRFTGTDRAVLEFALEVEGGVEDGFLVGEFVRRGTRVEIDFGGEPADQLALLPLPDNNVINLALSNGEQTIGTNDEQRIELDGDIIVDYAGERYEGLTGVEGRLAFRATRRGS
jgi:hypothetical protein